jgi:hypothetical protein
MMDRDPNLTQQKRYRARSKRECSRVNHEKLLAYHRQYRKRNRERISEYNRRRYVANREKLLAYQRHYQANKRRRWIGYRRRRRPAHGGPRVTTRAAARAAALPRYSMDEYQAWLRGEL